MPDADRVPPIHALVLLLSSPRKLTGRDLCAVAEAAWQRNLSMDRPDTEDDIVVGEPPTVLIRTGGFHFLVNVFDIPYESDPEESARHISELRLRRAYAGHKAWLSVDLLGEVSEKQTDWAYRYIGRLAADLIGDDTLAVYATATSRMNVPDDAFVERLRNEHPLTVMSELTQAPVAEIEPDDAEMAAAVEEARDTFDEFAAAFERGQGEDFAVKAPFSEGGRTEFIWVSVTAIGDGVIEGLLGNEPVALPGLQMGDEVAVELRDLTDWIYMQEGEMRGGFTVQVLAGRPE